MSKVNRPTTHAKHPSSARRRHETHTIISTQLRERKRLRKLRGEIHAALEQATALFNQPRLIVHVGPYRAPDVKEDGKGWQVLDYDERVTVYAGSRDKARAKAKELTDADEFYTESVPSTYASVDEALLELGWVRDLDVARGSIDEKYVRVAASASS